MDNTTITPDLLDFYANEHSSRSGSHKEYGTTGARNAGTDILRLLAGRPDIKTVLDFGAGSRTLERFLKQERPDLDITCYDPAIAGINKLPDRQFDLVVSSDVLEHIEPALIDNVIDTLVALTGKTMFHHIACSPCGLILPDGRNAHLIVEDPVWWKEKFAARPELILTEYRAIEKLQRRLQRLAAQVTLDKK